jgi:phosphoenolpyruvate carboxykinase (diphosphate)
MAWNNELAPASALGSCCGMDFQKQLGYYLPASPSSKTDSRVVQYINLKLAALGCPIFDGNGQNILNEIAAPLLANHREKDRLLADQLSPVDQRIRSFLTRYLGEELTRGRPLLPAKSFVLDRHGLARALSLPADGDSFSSSIVKSYRLKQGILHNPDKDRRTTQGVFHVSEGGLPIPGDKKGVPKKTFAHLLQHALNPPRESLRLPFTANREEQAEIFVSLLLRPVVCPAVPGVTPEKSMETRFFAPGTLVSNLDFVESIFGNAGDPFLPENDAALDVLHWSGHTGCVILAPHLIRLRKKEAGLPQWDQATERQRADGMCWKEEDELYNDGGAFKITCRDESGVVVTLIADNYFGYCKKEVKTQLSFAANLMGNCEEEHAGGALAFPTYDVGEDFFLHARREKFNHTFTEQAERFREIMDLQPEGYGVDKRYPNILYVPENTRFNLQNLTVTWTNDQGEQSIRLMPVKTYVRPSGYKVRMHKYANQSGWRLVGIVAQGMFCHKPSTVSGGGKSEISKAITDAILHGPVRTANIVNDLDQVEAILNRDYDDRFKPEFRHQSPSRPVLSPARSLGSVIKLLTPSKLEYTETYNAWLQSIPAYIKELVFVVKRLYRPEWREDWRSHFHVDMVNGQPGYELRCDNRRLVANFIRVGFDPDGSWRVFGLRSDYTPSVKIQMEDDISASIVVPADRLSFVAEGAAQPSVKLVRNCEYRLFQRPDDAILPGYDKQTEADFARQHNFLSNYQPLRQEDARRMLDDAILFDSFTPPMQTLIREAAAMTEPEFFGCTANPRIIDGKPSKNPRYLQDRPDLVNPEATYLAEIGHRFFMRLSPEAPVQHPVDAVLPGRRNNPPDKVQEIRSLAVFNPIHHLPLPELFIEFIASMTGKSPSTTGAGSEGALTKGPFNALLPVTDLNNALVAYILTGHHSYITAGGYIGPNFRVDHDISLLVPEIWCRMSDRERDPAYLIENAFLERVENFEYNGRQIEASRVGYRITARFVNYFFGRMFTNPGVIFTEKMLRPEQQDLEVFVDGIDNIIGTGQRVAELYFHDGSIELASPPLKALLHIMRDGRYGSNTLHDEEIRRLFTRKSLLESDWYRQRLEHQQQHDIALAQRHVRYVSEFLKRPGHEDIVEGLQLQDRLEATRRQLEHVQRAEYVDELVGFIGRDAVTLPDEGSR